MGVIRKPEQWIEDMIQNAEQRVLEKLAASPHVVEFAGNLASLCEWKRLKELMDLHTKLQPTGTVPLEQISDFVAGYLQGMKALPDYVSALVEAITNPRKPQNDDYGEEA